VRPAFVALSVVTGLFIGLLAIPAVAAAAGPCALSVATTPGHVITVTGTGFDANAAVDVTQTWSGSNATQGGNTGPQTTTSQVTADASGGFTFTIDAGPGHGGTYDLSATAGSCTATAQAVAVETAGGVNGGGAGFTPPPTDTVAIDRAHAPASLPLLPVLGGLALLVVAAVLVTGRRSRTGVDGAEGSHRQVG
jgi:hypothetical protein